MKTTRRSLFAALAGVVAWLKAPAVKAKPAPIKVISQIPGVVKPEDCKIWAYSSALDRCPIRQKDHEWIAHRLGRKDGITWALNFLPHWSWEPPDLQNGSELDRWIYDWTQRVCEERLRRIARGERPRGTVGSLATEFSYPWIIVRQALGEN